MIVSNSYSLSNFNSNFQKNCAILVVYGLCGYDILFLVFMCMPFSLQFNLVHICLSPKCL